MNFRRHKREVPGLNTTSTADISFMLLIFFLVTTSMGTEKGLVRQMPPADNSQSQDASHVAKGTLLSFRITDRDSLLLDSSVIAFSDAQKRIEEFVTKVGKRHIISIETAPNASYNAYFQLQNSILAAYKDVRERASMKRYGRHYGELTPFERDEIKADWPQRVTESYTESGEGGGR